RRAVRCLSPGSAHERVNHNPTRTPTRPKVDMRQDDSVDRLHRIDSEVETVDRSEEHTSELQSLTNLVCRLLLEKKKKNNKRTINEQTKTKKSNKNYTLNHTVYLV